MQNGIYLSDDVVDFRKIEEMKEAKKMEESEEIKETGEAEELEESESVVNVIEIIMKNIGAVYVVPNDFKMNLINGQANQCQEIIEWIPYNRLENVTYLAKGVLAQYTKQNGLMVLFIIGIIKKKIGEGKNAVAIYGITKTPKNEYMMVMRYASFGSLRKLLNIKFEILTWRRKYNILSTIINGLTNIHEMVTENIYGVIPYMAPETLSRGEYTQASDIYSFVLTSYPPYYNIPHNENLVMDICKRLKPEIKCEIPQFLRNFEPHNRPTAKELESQLNKYLSYDGEIRQQIKKQVKAANKSNKNFIQYDPNVMHPEAIYTSRHLSFLKTKKVEANTHDTKRWDFEVPDDM
ncbi:hypothetical protein Glove_454g21 [Diversispora epigaea]|uniref:Protein kinase domain-containing protein n=1 Tax=Diversispora epigaea TaxID=1348612 RepID=A0A397GTT7_9GLOM|nr:hypothetical protein Glove_454g21 [Diversispora epigaea]